MKCRKCGYVRRANETVSEGECPSCGIIYAKYHPAQQSPSLESSSRETSVAFEKVSNVNSFKFAAFALLCLIIGYFAGREHLKYEMRSAFSAAAEDLRKGSAGDIETSTNPTIDVSIEPPTNTLLRPQNTAPQVPAVPARVQNSVPRQDPKDCLKIVSFDSSELSTNSVFTEIAWLVDVANQCDTQFQVQVTFSLFDKDDFELDTNRANIVVGPNQTTKARSRMLVSPPEKARRIAKQGARISAR